MKRQRIVAKDFSTDDWAKPKKGKAQQASKPAPKAEKMPTQAMAISKQVVLAMDSWKQGTPLAHLAAQLGMRRKQLKRQFVKLLGGKPQFAEARANGAGGRGDFGGKRGGGRKPQAEQPLPDDKGVKVIRNLKWRKSDAIIDYAKAQCIQVSKKLEELRAERHTPKHYIVSLKRELEEMRAIAKQKKDNRWHWKQVPEHEPKIRKVQIKDRNGDKAQLEVKDTGTPILILVSPKGNEYVVAGTYEAADLILEQSDGSRKRLIRWKKSAQYAKHSKAMERHEEQLERGTAALERKQERRIAKRKAKKQAERAAKKAKRGRGRG